MAETAFGRQAVCANGDGVVAGGDITMCDGVKVHSIGLLTESPSSPLGTGLTGSDDGW